MAPRLVCLSAALLATASGERLLGGHASQLPVMRMRGGFKPAPVVAAASAATAGGALTAKADLVASAGPLGGIDFALLFTSRVVPEQLYYTLNNKYALKAAGGASDFPSPSASCRCSCSTTRSTSGRRPARAPSRR